MKITHKEIQVFAFIKEFKQKHGKPPNSREVGEHLNTTRQNAHLHMQSLHRKKFINYVPYMCILEILK